jgi:hypothetical protein
MKRWWRRPEERTEEYPWCYIMSTSCPPSLTATVTIGFCNVPSIRVQRFTYSKCAFMR